LLDQLNSNSFNNIKAIPENDGEIIHIQVNNGEVIFNKTSDFPTVILPTVHD
jgi:hypothetical protein